MMKLLQPGKLVIYFFTMVFLAVALLGGNAEQETQLPISVILENAEGEEKIVSWRDSSGDYFVFLPAYAQLGQARIRADSNVEVRINGEVMKDGMSCGSFQIDEMNTLEFPRGTGITQTTLTFCQSAAVPVMYIDVPSGSMTYIHQKKGNEESGTMRLYSRTGELLYSGDLDSIKGRGNGTWDCEKKPYSIKLSAEADLLGMGDAQKWILLANAYDTSQLRNKMVYDFAAAAGMAYSPDCEWVELYLNGQYAGLYLLSERNEIHDNRVALAQGRGFLVSKEWSWRLEEQNLPYIVTASGAALRIHGSTMDTERMTAIWQSAENAILAEDGMDPVTGKHWSELIDLDSWARKYILEELFGNPDASIISQFFYYEDTVTGGKICAGPAWDYDIAMGHTLMWPEYSANMFFANRDNIEETPWFHALYQKEEFYERVCRLWESDFKPLLDVLLDSGMDQYTSCIADAADSNARRWACGDAAKEWAYIHSYMTQRREFLCWIWEQDPDYFIVQANSGRGLLANYVLCPGECLPALPSYDDDSLIFYGWYREDTDEPFDVSQPIYEDLRIYLKQESAW